MSWKIGSYQSMFTYIKNFIYKKLYIHIYTSIQICIALWTDYDSWCGGLPDLILWINFNKDTINNLNDIPPVMDSQEIENTINFIIDENILQMNESENDEEYIEFECYNNIPYNMQPYFETYLDSNTNDEDINKILYKEKLKVKLDIYNEIQKKYQNINNALSSWTNHPFILLWLKEWQKKQQITDNFINKIKKKAELQYFDEHVLLYNNILSETRERNSIQCTDIENHKNCKICISSIALDIIKKSIISIKEIYDTLCINEKVSNIFDILGDDINNNQKNLQSSSSYISPICKLVEIKGPNDILSSKQIAWLELLVSFTQVEILHIQTSENVIQIRSRQKNFVSNDI